jgi:hypothetical protein
MIDLAAQAGFQTKVIRANQTASMPHGIVFANGTHRIKRAVFFGMANKFLW